MRLLSFVLLLILLPLLSCQSTETRIPSFDRSFSVLDSSLTLETVIANWTESLDRVNPRDPAARINWQEELHRLCLKQDGLCEFFQKSAKKREQLNKQLIAELSQKLEKEDYSAIQDFSVDLGLKFFNRYKKEKLLNYADSLLREADCRTIDLRHSLASTLEDELPDFQVKNTVQALYEKNSECPTSKTMTLSSYRAAMFRLVDQNCEKALPFLQKVSASSEDYLKPRSLYWTWRCQSESSHLARAETNMPYFSYHRLMMEDSEVNSQQQTPLAEKTPIKIETARNSYLNDAARLAEKLIARQMSPAARAVLEKIRVDKVQETEPEFQIYWAWLLNLTHAGIKKFQILASLVNTYPELRSKAVKDMLFPKLYFDHVSVTSKKIDPWLVQSLIRQESAFDPNARSRVGATGLMQIMPATARRISKARGQLKDPIYNVQAGVKFLEMLVNKFDGEVHLALAAYNAGPGKVTEWQKRYPTSDPMLFVDTIPYRETREYVAFILRNYHWYRSLNPEAKPDHVEPLSHLVRMATQIELY